MNVTKSAAAVLAAAVTFGMGAVNIAPASAADNIKIFGEQERLNGPNSQPYIGYTVFPLKPSTAPVPHNGQLYSANLVIDGFGGNTDPMIEPIRRPLGIRDFLPLYLGCVEWQQAVLRRGGPGAEQRRLERRRP